MQPRNVAFVGAICVTIGWLLASTLAPPVARVQSRPQDRGTPRPADTVEFTDQVQLPVRVSHPLPEGRRNPFVFVTRARTDAASSVVEPELTTLTPQEPANQGPAYVLSGIGITGETLTAVLTTGADVRIVKLNDNVDGYTVSAITPQTVTLTMDGARHVLRFAQAP